MRRLLPIAAGLLVILSVSALAQPRAALPHHVPMQLKTASFEGLVADTEPVHLSLQMNIDARRLEQELARIYSGSPGKPKPFLTSSQFAQIFGFAEKRRQIEAFARANGFSIDADGNPPESMSVKITGTASHVRQAFGVSMKHYRMRDGRTFRANDADPTIPTDLAAHLGFVSGLSTLQHVRQPAYRLSAQRARTGAVKPSFSGATGLGGSLAPADIKTIYSLSGTPLTGTGQTVALFELDGYNPPDIIAYTTNFGLGSVNVTPVSVDGTPNTCGGASCATQDPMVDTDMVEVALDIEMVAALAPGVTNILVYEGPNTGQGVLDQYDRIATDNAAQVISTSWGAPETLISPAELNAENVIFQRMATQGQTMYSAAGDHGALDGQATLTVNDPSAQPFVTGVGGTTLLGSVASPSEITWNNNPTSSATGGGVSQQWPLPAYQVGIAGEASASNRNVPDVALNADPNTGYAVFAGAGSVNGGWFIVGGTSAAAPLWGGMTALLNQQRATLGSGALGFANPTIYAIATSAAYSSIMHDITTGNNGFYSAGTGYDNTTGWGSFIGSAFINAINDVPTLSSLSPSSAILGDPGFVLTVNGANFISGSTVTWNGAARSTTFVSANQLQAVIDAADISALGAFSVAVINPISGGSQTSLTSLAFHVNYPGFITALSDVYAFPNPWDVRKTPPSVVTIANVPVGAIIRVFTISGFEVADLTASGESATWDLKNKSGQDVASGLYLYYVKYGDKTFRGKIAVIR